MLSNITFRHRLIGAIFLVSLAVIVIPAIFDRPKVETLASGSFPQAPLQAAALEELDKIEYSFTELIAPETVTPVEEVAPVEPAFIEPTLASSESIAPAPASTEPVSVATVVPETVTPETVVPETSTPAPEVISIPAHGEVIPKAEAPIVAATEKLITQYAWAVQLGAFAKIANAEALLKRVQAQGYTAYIQHMPDTKIARVLVGTAPDRQQATELLAEIDKTMQLKGIVVKFNP
jgi:DedD protein